MSADRSYSCQDAMAAMSDALAGEVERDPAVSLHLHMASCAACRSEFEAMLRIDNVARAAASASQTFEPSAGFTDRVMAKIRAEARGQRKDPARPRPASPWVRYGLSAAAGVLAATLVIAFVRLPTPGGIDSALKLEPSTDLAGMTSHGTTDGSPEPPPRLESADGDHSDRNGLAPIQQERDDPKERLATGIVPSAPPAGSKQDPLKHQQEAAPFRRKGTLRGALPGTGIEPGAETPGLSLIQSSPFGDSGQAVWILRAVVPPHSAGSIAFDPSFVFRGLCRLRAPDTAHVVISHRRDGTLLDQKEIQFAGAAFIKVRAPMAGDTIEFLNRGASRIEVHVEQQ